MRWGRLAALGVMAISLLATAAQADVRTIYRGALYNILDAHLEGPSSTADISGRFTKVSLFNADDVHFVDGGSYQLHIEERVGDNSFSYDYTGEYWDCAQTQHGCTRNYHCQTPECSPPQVPSQLPGANGFVISVGIDTSAFSQNPSVVPITFDDFGLHLTGTATVTRQTYKFSVPEPATWATLTLGFGVSGAALRRRRQREA